MRLKALKNRFNSPLKRGMLAAGIAWGVQGIIEASRFGYQEMIDFTADDICDDGNQAGKGTLDQTTPSLNQPFDLGPAYHHDSNFLNTHQVAEQMWFYNDLEPRDIYSRAEYEKGPRWSELIKYDESLNKMERAMGPNGLIWEWPQIEHRP